MRGIGAEAAFHSDEPEEEGIDKEQQELFDELNDLGKFLTSQEVGEKVEIKLSLEIKPTSSKAPIKIPICNGTVNPRYVEEVCHFMTKSKTFTDRVRVICGEPSGTFGTDAQEALNKLESKDQTE